MLLAGLLPIKLTLQFTDWPMVNTKGGGTPMYSVLRSSSSVKVKGQSPKSRMDRQKSNLDKSRPCKTAIKTRAHRLHRYFPQS